MITINFPALETFLQTNWGWAAGLAGAMLALTAFAASILNPGRKRQIARWLMGKQLEEHWASSFTALFDTVFGRQHLSLRCMIRSAIASMIAVVVIWALMGIGGVYDLRLRTELDLGVLLVVFLFANLVADYLSLLETRWLLGWLSKPRALPVQIAALIADFVVSGTIIWTAIFAVTWAAGIETDSFAEVLGVFSILSVLFYSTFLTSVWIWAYIASTAVLRLFTRWRLHETLDVEGKPLRILGLVMAGVVFVGSLGTAALLRPDEDGLTALDRGLCTIFKGPVCLNVAALTDTDSTKLSLVLLACEGGMSIECVRRAQERSDLAPNEILRLWEAACQTRDARGCTGLGVQHSLGQGVAVDHEEAARLYQIGCDGDYASGCTNLGLLYRHGRGVPQDHLEAVRLYSVACNLDDARGCNNLGIMYRRGFGVGQDLVEAIRLYELACDLESGAACSNLGFLYRRGLGVVPDINRAAELYRQACDLDSASGCNNLGWLYETSTGVEADPALAMQLYVIGCERGSDEACKGLERLGP